MSYLTQKTIKDNVKFKGIALHSGLEVSICIKPAEPNFGIVFKRVDLKANNLVYPNFMNVTNTSLNTTVENNFGVRVKEITGNPAFESGLLKNDIIYQISGKNIKNITQFEKIVKKMKKGDFASLLVRRSQGNSLYLAIKIE